MYSFVYSQLTPRKEPDARDREYWYFVVSFKPYRATEERTRAFELHGVWKRVKEELLAILDREAIYKAEITVYIAQ